MSAWPTRRRRARHVATLLQRCCNDVATMLQRVSQHCRIDVACVSHDAAWSLHARCALSHCFDVAVAALIGPTGTARRVPADKCATKPRHMSTHMSLHMAMHMHIHASIHMSIHMSIHTSTHVSIHTLMYILFMHVSLGVHALVHTSMRTSIHMSMHMSIHISIHIFIHISIHISIRNPTACLTGTNPNCLPSNA